MTRVLLVPGRNDPLPEHWQEWLARRDPAHRWVRHATGGRYVADERVAALAAALDGVAEPTVLVAHSAGCLTVALWAASCGPGPVRGALLVTPPDLDEPWTDGTSVLPALPDVPLPFPSILAASRTDPVMTYDRAEHWAGRWGAELVDLGDAGHLTTADGYGPWPLAETLIARLATHRARRSPASG
ncbi:RBBP9/YdeN family alpha/beta hydrolase [Micromonospora haikouensis]|uniref:RBBP9/YdeN family alpha/beta hydrolase n=1 Tax=Micromonospora haikouensis TaxID=686309 RepID=UPI00342DFAE7